MWVELSVSIKFHSWELQNQLQCLKPAMSHSLFIKNKKPIRERKHPLKQTMKHSTSHPAIIKCKHTNSGNKLPSPLIQQKYTRMLLVNQLLDNT